MIARYNRRSFVYGVPGIALQVIGFFALGEAERPQGALFGLLLTLVGTVFLFVGLAYYAKAKGRHPAWCLAALFSWVGLIVLGLLPDKAPLSE